MDSEESVYLSSDRGVFSIDMDNYFVRQRAFRLFVSEVRLDETAGTIDRDTPLSVDRDVAKIEFIPEIINYSHDDPTVSYYLEGFENDWTNVSAERA